MSGPKRELPPIHVKITGDPSGGLKAIQDVVDASKQAGKDIGAAGKKQTKAAQKEHDKQYDDIINFYKKTLKAGKKNAVDFYKDKQKIVKQQEKQLREQGKLMPAFAKTAKRYAKSSSPDLNALVKNAQTEDTLIRRQARSRRLEMNRRNKQMDRAYQDEAKTADKAAATRQAQQTAERSTQQKASEQLAKEIQATRDRIAKQSKAMETEDLRVLRRSRIRKRDRLRQEKKDYADRVNTANKHLAKLVQSGAKSQATQVQNVKSANTKLAAQVKAGQVIQRNAASRQDREDARVLRRQRMRERNRLQTRRDARQGQVAGLRQQGRALGSQAAGAMGGGGMMGARADMYMHQDTLKSMGSGILSLIRPFAQVENYTVQMEAFSGSVEKAQKTVAELQAFAIKSPYSLEGVLGASATLMKYGASAEHALEVTKLLGAVAGGDTNKLRLLAIGTGQAERMGKLRQQELNQLLNAGFSPLSIAAKEMAGPGADEAAITKMAQLLEENKQAGKLSAKIITAALKIATSKGGDFAGLLDKQSNTLTGLASQIIETVDLVSIEIVKVFAGDLGLLMKEVKRYLDATVEWVKANKDLVTSWVKFLIKVAEGIALFTALAMAMAYAKWIIGSLFIVLSPLVFMMKLLGGTLSLLVGIWKIVGTAGMIAGIKTGLAWLAATAPIWGTALAIAAVIAAFAALWFLVEGFSSDRGFAGIFQDGMTAAGNFLGFMWNFGENFVNIFKFIGANWKLLVYDMLITNNPLISLARMGAKALGMGKEFMGVEETMKNASMGLVGSDPQLDTSMFKFGMPSIDTKSVLGGMDSMFGVSEALKPYLKPLEGAPTIGDKPNIDFNQFLGKGGKGSSGGSANMGNREHAIRGSGDHAVRMYEYGESVKPMAATDPKQDLQKQMVDSLNKIEKNTRLDRPLQGGTGIEEAALTR